MSNPFDQFATDFRVAVPDAPAPAPAEYAAFQAPAKAPAMNMPPQQMNGSMNYGGYGAPPSSAAPQPPMGQTAYGYSASPGYGMPQQAAPPMPMSQPATDPYAAGGMFAPASPAPAQPPATDPYAYGVPAPFGGYDASQQAPMSQPYPGAPPFGMPEAAPEAAPPSPPGANPFEAPPSPPGQVDNPFAASMLGGPPMQPQMQPPMPPQGAPPMPPNPYGTDPGQGQYQDPWGASTGAIVPAGQSIDAMFGALVPAQPSQQYGNIDPFAVFAGAPAPEPAPAAMVPFVPVIQEPVSAPAPQSEDDIWKDMGFDAPVPDAPNPAADEGAIVPAEKSEKHVPGELPPGGEWYDARIFTPTLGVMFFKPQELTDSLFLQTEKSLVDALEERPVVAFIVEGSSARSAGVELGHVLLKVNGIDVKNPKEASRLIKEGPRPLPLLFYVPDTNVVVAEGEHMVKYDTRETTAPNSAKDWKPKYVVIGGIIAQPWMINMYRSKVSSLEHVEKLASIFDYSRIFFSRSTTLPLLRLRQDVPYL